MPVTNPNRPYAALTEAAVNQYAQALEPTPAERRQIARERLHSMTPAIRAILAKLAAMTPEERMKELPDLGVLTSEQQYEFALMCRDANPRYRRQLHERAKEILGNGERLRSSMTAEERAVIADARRLGMINDRKVKRAAPAEDNIDLYRD